MSMELCISKTWFNRLTGHTPITGNLQVLAGLVSSAVVAGLGVFTQSATYHNIRPKRTNSAPCVSTLHVTCLHGHSLNPLLSAPEARPLWTTVIPAATASTSFATQGGSEQELSVSPRQGLCKIKKEATVEPKVKYLSSDTE